MNPSIDMRGRRYGRLTVTGQGSKQGRWLCLCECGQRKEISGAHLRSGNTQSCGCLRDERIRQACCTHRMSGSRIYRLWSMMIDRCQNPQNKFFPEYGGRGITVCHRWKQFEEFYADMGDRPKGKSLDRINNDIGYSPENCRWATQKQQCRNRRSNRLLTYQGKTQSIAAWAEDLGVNYNTLNTRVQRGWDDERVLSQPIKPVSVA